MKKHSSAIGAIFFLVLLTLILVRVKKGNYYRESAASVHEITLGQPVFINLKSLDTLSAKPLLLFMSEVSENHAGALNSFANLYIKPADVLSPDNRKALKNHSGSLVIYAQSKELAANTWVLLSRMGVKKLFVFDAEGVTELNYSFQPNPLSD